jgi:hypothetical protein
VIPLATPNISKLKLFGVNHISAIFVLSNSYTNCHGLCCDDDSIFLVHGIVLKNVSKSEDTVVKSSKSSELSVINFIHIGLDHGGQFF